MSKDNTLIYVALGLGAVYLLSRKGTSLLPGQSSTTIVSNPTHLPAQTAISPVQDVGLLLPVIQKLFGGGSSSNSQPVTVTPVTDTTFTTSGTAENVSDTSEAGYWQSQSPTAITASPSDSSGTLVTQADSSPTGFDLTSGDGTDLTFLNDYYG